MGERSEPTGVAMFTPTLAAGGAERVLVNLLKILGDVPRHLVLMERHISYPFDARLHVLAGQFASGGGAPARRLWRVGENLARLSLLKRQLPVVWVSFATWANILNVLAGGGRPTVLTSHNHESLNIQGRLESVLRALIRFTYPRADVVVAVSNSVKRDLVENFGVPPERVVTIYNTLDMEEAERLAEAPPEPELAALLASSPTIVTAGNLKAQKGHWHLLRVFAELKRRRPDARLVFLGEGPLGPYLTGLSRELGLATYVHSEGANPVAASAADVVFAGYTPNPFAIFKRATLFAFPSLWEGFGNVLVEAMAMGCPVISSDCPSGPREILAPERLESAPLERAEFASAGVLMPRFDGERRGAAVPLTRAEREWAETLATILDDPERRAQYRDAGQRRARSFTIEAIGPEWRRLLERVATPRAGTARGA